MNTDPWQREFDVALAALREATLLARDIREDVGDRALLKPDRSPVTVADFAVQALVAYRLAKAFPDDPLVAEEDAATLRASAGRSTLDAVLVALRRAMMGVNADCVLDLIDRGRGAPGERFWTLDPVDGTQGFVRGDQYVVALALVIGGRAEIGLLGCPGLSLSNSPRHDVGAIACAVKNRGAFSVSIAGHEFVPLHVSSCREPRTARVLRSFEADHIDLDTFNEIVREVGVEAPPTLMDSQAKHATIAAGGADLLIRIPAAPSYRDKIWDQAAGSLIIEEAGGQVTDLHGAPLDFSTGRLMVHNDGVIASNGHLHRAVVDAARRVMSKSL